MVAFIQKLDARRRQSCSRGDKILQVDGEDAVNGNTQAVVDALNAGLFPDNASQSHTFVVQNVAGAQRTVTITPAFIAHGSRAGLDRLQYADR